MEYRYLKTTIGKIHAALIAPTVPLLLIGFYLEYIKGKEPNFYGIGLSIIGFLLFLKAKLTVIKSGKWFSFGCDLMDQKHVYFYFFGWILMIAGYFLSWSKL